MRAKLFFIYENFFINHISFCYCRGSYGPWYSGSESIIKKLEIEKKEKSDPNETNNEMNRFL